MLLSRNHGAKDVGEQITVSKSAESNLKTSNVTIVDYQVISKRFAGNWLLKKHKISLKKMIEEKRRRELQDRVVRDLDPNHQDRGAILDHKHQNIRDHVTIQETKVTNPTVFSLC